jgi:hypothetical protein
MLAWALFVQGFPQYPAFVQNDSVQNEGLVVVVVVGSVTLTLHFQ